MKNKLEEKFELLDWIRGIASKMFPQVVKGGYRQYEVEKLLIEVGKEHLKLTESNDKKYNELILAVGNKYKGETRHQTALRYIKQAETSDNKSSKDSL